MKWNTPHREAEPVDGTIRWTLKFAWLPKICSDGYTRWLCDVYVKQRYTVVRNSMLADESWVDLEYAGAIPLSDR
jgi:hypothetical protein